MQTRTRTRTFFRCAWVCLYQRCVNRWIYSSSSRKARPPSRTFQDWGYLQARPKRRKRVISWVIRLVIRLVMSWLHTTCHSYVMSYPLWVLSWRVYGLVCGFTSTRKATGAPHRKKVSAFAGDRHQAESKKWQVAVTLCRKWDVCVCVFVSLCLCAIA